MNCVRRRYPSDVNELQWKLINKLIPTASRRGRPRAVNLCRVVNAIFYVVRTGVAWRYLPKNFPPWQTVYRYFRKWKNEGIIEKIHQSLVAAARTRDNREESPHVLIIDSQSIKSQFGESRGYDGFKKVRGRKRNILVDTLGFLHAQKVDQADKKDHFSGIEVVKRAPSYSLNALYADGAYKGGFDVAVFNQFGIWPTLTVSKTKKQDEIGRQTRTLIESGLKPVRWIVERTFGWFNFYRRLSRDYERKTSSSESMIYLAMTCIMLNRLTNQLPNPRWT